VAAKKSVIAYAFTITVSSFLLFQVQPLISRFILPWFGGAPSVWTVCMLFFQCVLLLGYTYSHLLVTKLGVRRQALLHIGLLCVSVLCLPIIPAVGWKPGIVEYPPAYILAMLGAVVGLPYFLLSTTAPLIQAWFGRHYRGSSPYRLYALSNASSLVALLSYPFFFEPNFSLTNQAYFWSGGYLLFVIGCMLCAYLIAKKTEDDREEIRPVGGDEVGEGIPDPPKKEEYLLWFLFPCCASVLLLAITNELCQDVAVVPFLWIAPLSLYLLSFILTFDGTRWYSRKLWLPLSLVCLFLLQKASRYVEEGTIVTDITVWCVTLFVYCMVCHGELVKTKPPPRYLTSFYLMISAGGAAGGIFVGLIAPHVFSSYLELPIGLACCLLLTLFVLLRQIPRHKGFSLEVGARAVGLAGHAGVIVVGGALLYSGVRDHDDPIVTSRGFYGILRIDDEDEDDPESYMRFMQHGNIIHGVQFMAEKKRHIPLTYYGRKTGLGRALRAHPKKTNRKFGAIGLGTGTVAVFGKLGDTFRFYEINPEVIKYASSHFTFLKDSKAEIEVIEGDARLSLEREEPQGFDFLILDAFSGDAPPAHLLTKEAFEVYLKHLSPKGVILANISNRYFDLSPLLWGIADSLGLGSLLLVTDDKEPREVYGADWMLVTRDRTFLSHPKLEKVAYPRDDDVQLIVWTDNHSSLFAVIYREEDEA